MLCVDGLDSNDVLAGNGGETGLCCCDLEMKYVCNLRFVEVCVRHFTIAGLAWWLNFGNGRISEDEDGGSGEDFKIYLRIGVKSSEFEGWNLLGRSRVII